ncbi:MAG TPA: AzlC family ABC transporter permease [Candidatus Fournierella excrementavium]|uniref:AzlC family ABC transporter permease n=1 Tax=Candidatus Allofournierella excrementavium TaxID=2838591 RepID=UPI0015B36E0E|nr:AzlC family ABC transporter permease [Oscillospiraceae bacterium]HJD17834.1 AzlC family ABC transporter permease [Candidatus Fournierella excrementavium]
METNWRQTARFAFRQSLGVLFGYVFLGTAFGILLRQAGFGALWSLAFSGLVYAGSLQFVLAGFLAAPTALPTVALMSLFINARHLFYGLSFIERFRSMGKKRPYMIFSLTDETYSVLCGMDEVPAGVDKNGAMFLVALLDQLYWVAGSLLGTFAGGLPLDFTGIDFSMTALFLVIFLEQWRGAKSHLPALLGLGCGAVFLLALGPDNFLLPALCTTVAVLLLARPVLNREKEAA